MKITKIIGPSGCGKTFIANAVKEKSDSYAEINSSTSLFTVENIQAKTVIFDEYRKDNKDIKKIIDILEKKGVEFFIIISEENFNTY